MNKKWLIKAGVSLVCLFGLAVSIAAQGKDGSASTQAQGVKFDGGRVKLAGTLAMPKIEAGRRAPAVMIIPDAGATTQDGVAFGAAQHPIYRDLAEYLAARGMIVLRYDKRCAGESECKPADSFDDFIDDARGGLNFLRGHAQVDASRIFIFGHGEGALIACSIATYDEEKLAGLVLLAMPGRTLNKIQRDQIEKQMAETGKSAEVINAFLAKYDRATRGIMAGKTEFPELKLDPKDPYESILAGLIKQHQISVSLLVNDPLQIIGVVKEPILILQGKKDVQVSVRDGQFVEEALKRAFHQDMTVLFVDDLDHLLKVNKGAATFASLEDASRPLDPAALKTIIDWLEKRSKTAKNAARS